MKTRFARIWADERLVDVEIRISHLGRIAPDDAPEWRCVSACDSETNESVTITDEQAELAFLRCIGVEERI